MKQHLRLSLVIALCAWIGSAIADNSVRHYQIPAQPLNSALQKLADQSGIAVMFTEKLVAGKTSTSLIGEYTAEDALKKILVGTGLGYTFTSGDAVAINGPDIGSDAATTMPAVKVVGKAVNDVHDPYYKGYTVPNATAGTKTDTPIMETPLNVQVVSKQVLKDQQIINFTDALKNVSGVTNGPNLASFSFGMTRQAITLRGFSSDTFFRNGFRLYEGVGQREMANVESVEVLKGSAAILHGLVEPGGIVNVTTKQPLATPYYALQQQFGSYNLYRTTIDATGPLTDDDTLLYRMNMSYENSGSFRDFVDNEKIFLAPVLKWNISADTQATLELEYNHDNLGLDIHYVPIFNKQFVKIPRSRNYGEPASKGEIETIFVGLNWSHRFNDNWSIKHRFSFNQQSTNSHLISTQSPSLSPNGNQVPRVKWNWEFLYDTYATNIDLTGHFNTFGLKHTLLFGGDYYRVDSVRNNEPFVFNFSFIDIENPVHPGTPFPPLVNPNPATTVPIKTDQYGLYLQDQIELPYDLFFIGGFRYQYIHKTSFRQAAGSQPNVRTPLTAEAITPRVGLLWQPQNWLSLYANYVESFGDNSDDTQIYPGKIAPPSGAQQWEIGAKTEFFGGRLRTTLAYYDLTKQNVTTADPSHPGFSILTGEVHSRGYELDIQGEILPGWNMIGTYSNTDIHVTKSNDSFPSVGDRYFGVPRNTASLWSTYDFQQSALEGLKTGGGITMRDSQLAARNNTSIPGYATVDLLAAYSLKIGQSKITAQVNINNLLDKYYYSSAYIPSVSQKPGYDRIYTTFGQPRSVMGSIRVEF